MPSLREILPKQSSSGHSGILPDTCQTVKRQTQTTDNQPRCNVPRHMTGRKGIDPIVRQRISAWVKQYMDEHREDGVPIKRQELERRLGVAPGTGTRILQGQRIGLDVFIKIVLLIRVKADTILFEDPRPRSDRPRRA